MTPGEVLGTVVIAGLVVLLGAVRHLRRHPPGQTLRPQAPPDPHPELREAVRRIEERQRRTGRSSC